MINGIRKRFGRKPPRIKNKREFRDFVRRWLRKYLIPLSSETNLDFEYWLSLTSYPEWRKNELRKAYQLLIERGPGRWMYKNKMHVKAEFYEEFKRCRLINARVDGAKCFFGPCMKQIESVLYQLPYFIKHVPVVDRPRYISEHIHDRNFTYSGDYTAFESHMTKEMMNICEFQLYSYMLRDVVGGSELIYHLKKALGGMNYCFNSNVEVKVSATRMSGDMCTSLGNGFTNLMCIAFMMSKKGVKFEDFDVLVEGDDSLISSPVELSINDFRDVGLTMKILDKEVKVGDAAFCSFVFSENFENIINPVETIAKFGWSLTASKGAGDKVKRGLLRAKVDSLMCEAPRCPIINSMIRYYRRVLKDVIPKFEWNWWDAEIRKLHFYDECLMRLNKGVDYADRVLMEEHFHIPISSQLVVEDYFDGLNELCPLIIPEFEDHIPSDWHINWDRYVLLN